MIATPVLALTLMLIILERFFAIGFFEPLLGGDPLLYEHMFWIYSHPAVYIMILPAMGVVTEIFPVFSRRTIFGYRAIAFSSLGDRFFRLSRLGPPHVYKRDERYIEDRLFSHYVHGCGADRRKGLQLAVNAL